MAKFIDIKVRVDTSRLTAKTARQQQAIQDLPERALKFFQAQTPIRSGNARRNTRLESGDTIRADYAYAQRLDEGWSRQSPRGMTEPTERWLRKEFKKIFGRK